MEEHMKENRPEQKALDSARSGLVAAVVVSVLLTWILRFTGSELNHGTLVPFYLVMGGYIILCVVQLLRAKKAVDAAPAEGSAEGSSFSRVDQQVMYSKMGLAVVTLIFSLVAPLISEAYAPLRDRPLVYVALLASLWRSYQEYREAKKQQ